jgi:hypothetical protein
VLHQGLYLGFELHLNRLHASIAHGFVAAGIGLDFGAVDCDGTQLY